MTNRIALWLAIVIVGLVALDQVMGWGALLFLLRKFADLIEWIAFWR